MVAIARDSVAADQLVYVWPHPITGGAEVSCGEDEVVVMCPAWTVGDKLGPGRHNWRSPDPSKPVSAYFVLTAPVEAPFDMATSFVIPSTQQPVRLRASGTLLVRAGDPGLLVAQFVGLPVENLNTGVVRSVSMSMARLVSRVLVRRVVMMGTPLAVADPSMMGSIMEEVVAYNPAAGAVFGLEFVRLLQLDIHADDGGLGWQAHVSSSDWRMQTHAQQAGAQQPSSQTSGVGGGSREPAPPAPAAPPGVVAGEIGVVSGEIQPRTTTRPPGSDPLVLAAGRRVLVAGPDGLLHAAVVRQHMQGYYEIEVGATGETVWVPEAQVVPEG